MQNQIEIARLFQDFKKHDAQSYHTINSMLERFYYYAAYRGAALNALAEIVLKRLGTTATEKVTVDDDVVNGLEKALNSYFKPNPSSAAR